MTRPGHPAPTDPLSPAGGLESAAGTDSRYPALDGLRGLAALAVVLTHIGFQTGEGVSGPLRSVLARLDIGVAIFFALSGFLLHLPQVRAAMTGARLPPLGRYLRRRALRILPAYWVAVVLTMLLAPANRDLPPQEWLWQLALLQVYADDHLVGAFTQVWSLCTEVSFYLALPFLGRLLARGAPGARAVVRRQLVLAAAMVVTACAWQLAVSEGLLPLRATLWLPGYTGWFAAGMVLATVTTARSVAPGQGWWDRLDDLAGDAGTCWAGAAALFVIAGTPLLGSYGLDVATASEAVLRSLLYGAIAVLLLLPATLPGRRDGVVRGLLSSPPMVLLGQVSYGVFLLHLLVLEHVLRVLQIPVFTGRALLVTCLVVPLSVLAGWLSLVLVERPALRLGAGPRTSPAPG